MHKKLLSSVALLSLAMSLSAVEIPLDTVSPVRIGYIDLQKVFDTFPEKAFAEGDLLKEIAKRRTELATRQNAVNVMRRQIAADQAALDQAKLGKPVVVPIDEVSALPPLEPVAAPPPPPAEPAVKKSTTPAAVEPYPTEEPLAGLPGHGADAAKSTKPLPGMDQSPETVKATASPLLDSIAASGNTAQLNPEAQAALQKRIDNTKQALDLSVRKFRNYRGKALEDMKQLQTQKTYGVMSKIYALLQSLSRDESITVVLDKTYVLYGEDSVDLTDKLIERLNQGQL